MTRSRIITIILTAIIVLGNIGITDASVKVGNVKSMYCYKQGKYIVFKWSKARNATRYKVAYTKRILDYKNGKYKRTLKYWKVKYKKSRTLKIRAKKGQFVYALVIACRGKKESKGFAHAYKMMTKKKYKMGTKYDMYILFASYFWDKNNFPYSPKDLEEYMEEKNAYIYGTIYDKTYKYFIKNEKINWADVAYHYLKFYDFGFYRTDSIEDEMINDYWFSEKDVKKALERAAKADGIVSSYFDDE